MATQAMVPVDKTANVRGLLKKLEPQLKLALPKHVTADRFLRVAMTSIQRTPKLLECSPQSLLSSIMTAGQLGLECDNVRGEAYLLPYGTQAQLIIGYRGLVKLARQSGEVGMIFAREVYENDEFSYQFGTAPKCEHKPALVEPRGAIIAVYAVCVFKDGTAQFDVMSRGEVDAIRKRSRAGNSGPWVTDYVEMAKKTVLRRLCKMLPVSVELSDAVGHDERQEVGITDVHVDLPELPAMTVEPEPQPSEAEPEPDPQTVVQPEALDQAKAHIQELARKRGIKPQEPQI